MPAHKMRDLTALNAFFEFLFALAVEFRYRTLARSVQPSLRI